MCGIAGFLGGEWHDERGVVAAMTGAIAHRGPDDSGAWSDPAARIVLGHRRLSILDLSPAGHQPMTSPSGRYVTVFNGEIYNHLAIRAELERGAKAPPWRGHSDTETLLAAMDAWGFVTTLEKTVGMFAIAVWDRERRRLLLARDRVGEKPLYYGQQRGVFLFGSELKALRAHPAFAGEIDRGALALYLRHNYVPDPLSIYVGIAKLSPGTWLEVDERGGHGAPTASWNAADAVERGRVQPFAVTPSEALARLDGLLREAIAGQMIADVPLGAFLSGGVDSSLTVALMQAQSAQPIRTFTIGFAEAEYDESPHARAVAQHLGTNHTELRVTPAEAMEVVPRLHEIYDEPFGDSSQIPTTLVCQLARRHVTVSLSGDGGDELFGGYTRYALARRAWNGVGRIPVPLRRAGAAAIRALSPESWDALARAAAPLLPRSLRAAHPGDRLHKGSALLADGTRSAVYMTLMSHWHEPADLCGVPEPASRLAELMRSTEALPFEAAMTYWDLLTYLPGDILVKVDRAAMSTSLETRVPLLDHRVVEFAYSLPLDLRIRDGVGKWPLRELLYRHVPRALIERPKQGFGVPIEAWLRGPLRDWAEALLDEARLRREGHFAPGEIRRRWAEHLAGSRNWSYSLWDVLMFQAWHEGAGAAPAAAAPAAASGLGA